MYEDGVFLDLEAMELVDGCIHSCVPIYILAKYAEDIENDPILSERYLKNLSKKMLDKWSEMVHNHKHLISESDLKNLAFTGEYPRHTVIGLDQLRAAYYGPKHRRHKICN